MSDGRQSYIFRPSRKRSRFDVLVITFLSILFLVTPVREISAKQTSFQTLYDYYFPRHGQYLDTFYRHGFDATLFGPSPKAGEERHPVYYAFRGDPVAFHAFAHHPDRQEEGEFALTWANECLVLLLHLGDDRFSELLAREDRTTREIIGSVIDCRIQWTKHHFPKTRAQYAYRSIPPGHQALEKKHGNGVSRLMASLANEKRFAGVRVYNRKDERGTILITVPKSLSRRDVTDLQRLMRQCVGDDASLTIE